MRNVIRTVILIVAAGLKLWAGDIPFNRGINLTGWFQAPNVYEMQFTKYTFKDFENIKSLGCDVIRLPINLHYMTGGPSDYRLDSLFLFFLDQAVDWADSLGIYIILDNHTFDVNQDTDPEIGDVLKKVWVQMAGHYKNRSDRVLYEVLNEPHGISDEVWNSIQQEVVAAIRSVDTVHTIVIGPAGWNSFRNLDKMPVYDDDNLIYTFHFYDPFLFTHQGATWTNPSMESLADVPFPYAADSMPELPAELSGTWIETAYNNYPFTGTEDYVRSQIDIAVAFKNERKVPVYCGEFGVFMKNSRNEDRVLWYETARKYLESNDIPWTIWDYQGGFGLFEKGGNDMFDHDLNVPLLEALDLNVPEQTEYIMKPDSTGFMVYTDFIGSEIYNMSYTRGRIDFYSGDQPNNGKVCLKWTDASQYDHLSFDFKPDKDMSGLVRDSYALDMIVRSGIAGLKFDVRFLDTKTEDPDDHPWRIVYTVDESMVPSDSRWHHIFIPLSQFAEGGSWDNGWYNPEGKFDWSRIDRFEISNEYDIFGEGSIWFDNIIVTDEDTARVLDDSVFIDPEITATETAEIPEIRVYPNPVNGLLLIDDPTGEKVACQLVDVCGRVLKESEFRGAARLHMSGLAQGIYFIKILKNDGTAETRKIIKQ